MTILLKKEMANNLILNISLRPLQNLPYFFQTYYLPFKEKMGQIKQIKYF